MSSPAIKFKEQKAVFLFRDRPRHLTSIFGRYPRDTHGSKFSNT
jgi:hypothetical protein